MQKYNRKVTAILGKKQTIQKSFHNEMSPTQQINYVFNEKNYTLP